MVALIVGIVFVLFSVFSVLPFGLNWGPYVLDVLKGAAPIIALLIGVVAVFIGIADMKDQAEAKKEEAAAETAETTETKE